MENDKNLGFNAHVSSQEDVKKMYKKIQKISKADQLSIMKREIKLKKLLFCELPPDYPLFRQYNIAPDLMFNNSLALHVVEESNQESVSVEDIYEITESLLLPMSKLPNMILCSNWIKIIRLLNLNRKIDCKYCLRNNYFQKQYVNQFCINFEKIRKALNHHIITNN